MEKQTSDTAERIGSLENRVSHLEVMTGEIRTKLESMAENVSTNMATKADIAMLMTEMAKQKAYVSERLEQHLRMVLVTLAGTLIAGVTIMTFVLNFAAPPRGAAAPTAPVIIPSPQEASWHRRPETAMRSGRTIEGGCRRGRAISGE